MPRCSCQPIGTTTERETQRRQNGPQVSRRGTCKCVSGELGWFPGAR